MSKALTLLRRVRAAVADLRADEGGATLIEYTVLLGILLIAVIAVIVAVGHWISGQWSSLNTTV